jgi:hypothetical protein
VTDDDLELRALVGVAWEKRGTPGYGEALDAICEWHDRRFVRAWERRQRHLAYIASLLRDPPREQRAAA